MLQYRAWNKEKAGHAISLGGYRFARDVQRWREPPQGNTVGPQVV